MTNDFVKKKREGERKNMLEKKKTRMYITSNRKIKSGWKIWVDKKKDNTRTIIALYFNIFWSGLKIRT